MINHFQTLLLNESASTVVSALPVAEYGFIDPSFQKVALRGDVLDAYLSMFPEGDDILSKIPYVKSFITYLYEPEFSNIREKFDNRVCSRSSLPADVFDFYSSMSSRKPVPIGDIVTSVYAPSVFLPTGNGMLDYTLGMANDVYTGSREVVKRFTAFLFAMCVHIEAGRLRALG